MPPLGEDKHGQPPCPPWHLASLQALCMPFPHSQHSNCDSCTALLGPRSGRGHREPILQASVYASIKWKGIYSASRVDSEPLPHTGLGSPLTPEGEPVGSPGSLSLWPY